MNDAVMVAIISASGLLTSGVLVELIRTRRKAEKVVAEVQPNGGGSLRDVITRIEAQVDRIRDTQVTHGERIAKIEGTIKNCGGE